MKTLDWSDFNDVRSEICGYQEAPPTAINKAREYAKLAMRRLYAKRRAMGLNAHGKPLKRK